MAEKKRWNQLVLSTVQSYRAFRDGASHAARAKAALPEVYDGTEINNIAADLENKAFEALLGVLKRALEVYKKESDGEVWSLIGRASCFMESAKAFRPISSYVLRTQDNAEDAILAEINHMDMHFRMGLENVLSRLADLLTEQEKPGPKRG